MKKNTRHVFLVLIAVLLQFALLASASAATITRNGLEITLTTDRTNYSAGDSIVCSVELNNTSEQELTLTYDVTLPDTLEAATAERSVLVIGAIEKASDSFTLYAAGKGADSVPSTGDSFPFGLVCCLFVAALIVGVGLIKGKKRFMAFMLVFVLFFAVAEPLFSAPAVAEEIDNDEIRPVYEEDAYQIDCEEEITEDDASFEAVVEEFTEVDPKTVAPFSDSFTLHHQVYVDNKLTTIRLNASLSNGIDESLADSDKATLGTVSVTSVKVDGNRSFRFNWKAVSGATHYEIWRKKTDGSGVYVKVNTVSDITYYTQTGIPGKVNTYRIRAIKKSGSKIVSTGAYRYVFCYGMVIPKITSVKYTSSTSGDVRIKWNAVPYCTGYKVFRSYSGKSGTYTLIGTTSSTSFVDKKRNGYYKIRAYYKHTSGNMYYSSSSAKASMGAQYRALIIGQSYPSWSSGQLPGCLTDAKAMKATLDSMSNFRPIAVKMKTNLTSQQILSAITSTFSRAKDNDVAVFYYSGHGVNTEGWLCGVNSNTQYDYVTVADLKKALDAVHGRKLVLLDSCYSGMFINKSNNGDIIFVSEKEAEALGFDKTMSDQEAMDTFTENVINVFAAADKASNLATSNYYVMTGCSKYQTSAELISGSTRFGLFTNQLLEASGYSSNSGSFYPIMYGDTNNSGKLSLKELYDYTYKGVNEIAEYLGISQSVRVYPSNSNFVCWSK